MNVRAMATRAAVTTSAVAAAVMLAGTQSASASVDDSFAVVTLDGKCGQANFVDYGPGAPGGGNNDDYVEIHDYCSDGLGVRAYAWVNGRYLGARNNTNGLKGAKVVWDPFGNVKSGSSVGLKVCLFDKYNTLYNCNERTKTRVDG